MVSNISREDVLIVGHSINKRLTEEQVNKVLHMYPHEEECDPTGTWNLIVEHCIHQVLNS
jgi:hypothetical protein